MTNPIYVAIDPSMKCSGIAVYWDDGKVNTESVHGFGNASESYCLKSVYTRSELHDMHVRLVIEYPPAGAPSGPQTRNCANGWIELFKKAMPRKVKVCKVSPRTWQALLTKGMPGDDPKARSIARARMDYPGRTIDNDNVADALNMLTYGRMPGVEYK